MKADYRELAAGGLLIAIGLFFALYASSRYSMGTLGRMGPGMFPTMAGSILVVLGVMVVAPALRRSGHLPLPDIRPALFVLASAVVFGLAINRFGLIPAVIGLTLVAVPADPRGRLGWRGALLLAFVLAVMIALIFRVGLGVPVSLARWPF